MRNRVPPFLTLAAALVLGAAAFAVDRTPSAAPTLQTAPSRVVLPDDQPLPRGRVVALDETAGSITLDYAPIPSLFLEGGTRTFAVDDAAELTGLSPGDKVRFDVERIGRRYTVTHLENTN